MPQYLPYQPKTILRVEGEDAASFLQGQFTNELRQAPGSAVYGLFLNLKGKVVADAQVLKLAENSWLVTSVSSPAASIQQRLEEYIIADDVMVQDETPAMHGMAILGADVAQLRSIGMGEPPARGRFGRSGELFAFAGRRTRAENYEILGPEKPLRELREELKSRGWLEMTAGEIEYLRIKDGIPAIPEDVGPGDLPNEGGLDVEAISYSKGCYLGQEIMARLKNMGQVRRRLFILQGRGGAPGIGAALFQGDKKLGEIRSIAAQGSEFAALAMVSLFNLDRATGLSLAPGSPPTLMISSRE
jgi:folate-binding protein YgfZ